MSKNKEKQVKIKEGKDKVNVKHVGTRPPKPPRK